ncbi:hypothetical protein SAMN05216466_101136 [Paraburkholderia phenazinium]|uniref:Peptide-binding protein n=1 Tax=Paraburkholderia phenazinium TaxID=60549 RepID=A0A1G7P313_9BURK|nr:hypothetical protein SAMN05216466_101136 [Paraburkholderia phenazinium]
MVDAGWVKTRQWVMGAAFAALCSLACAKAPETPHGGGPGGGFAHSGFQHEGRNGRAYDAHAERGAPAQRNLRAANGMGGPRRGYNAPQRVAGGGYRGDARSDPRGGFQYAGAITPVSAETHSIPRPPEDETLVRAGSIRADVARYNEERGAARQVPRPPEYIGRPPTSSPYRN